MLQGFGNVGSWAARIIAQLGATVIAVSDAHGAVHAEDGLDPEALALHVREGGKVAEFDGDGAEAITPEELLALECEAFIPAALGGMIHAGNADLLNTPHGRRGRQLPHHARRPTRSWRARASTSCPT